MLEEKFLLTGVIFWCKTFAKSRSETITMPMICSLMEHGLLPVFSIEGKVMLYSERFYKTPRACLLDISPAAVIVMKTNRSGLLWF